MSAQEWNIWKWVALFEAVGCSAMGLYLSYIGNMETHLGRVWLGGLFCATGMAFWVVFMTWKPRRKRKAKPKYQFSTSNDSTGTTWIKP